MAEEVIDLVASPPGANPPFARARKFPRLHGGHPAIDHNMDISDPEDDTSQAWRRRRRRDKKRQRTAEYPVDDAPARGRFKTDPNEPIVVVGSPTPAKKARQSSSPQAQLPPGLSDAEIAVLDIFPDCELQHLKQLLKQNSHQSDIVIMHLLDNPSYPKESNPHQHRHHLGGGSPLVKLAGLKWSYDFMVQGAFDATASPQYVAEVRLLLQNLVPLFNVKALNLLLAKHNYHYAICHDRILTALKAGASNNDELNQFRQVEAAVETGRLLRPDDQKAALALLTGLDVNAAFIRNARKRVAVPLTDPILKEETQFVDSKWQEYKRSMRARIEREQHKLEADRAGVGLECTCCFDTYAVQDMVTCRDYGHLCCFDCLDMFASTKMWGDGNFGVDKTTKKPLLDLICFHGGDDGCTSIFDRESLVRALTSKNLVKYDELQCQLVVGQVFGDDLVSCPKCDYRAALPQGQKIFSCPVNGCRFESCRECGEAAHIPFRCDEVEKEIAAKGRLTVEEAITQAKIRRCPNARCKQPFVKSDGCNKVTCSCGTLICYVCRKAIKDYTHFCQTPHCQHKSCNKCPLWTKAEEDDARAMREAGLQAASEVASTTAGVNIDVEELLKAGVAGTAVAAKAK